MENEKLDLQVGDRVTYRFIDKDGIFTEIVSSSNLSLASIHWFKELLEDKEIEIIKIERPKYEVVEEKKELLTDEEKEFLKQYIKMSPLNIDYIKKEFNMSKSITIILNDGQGTGFCTYYNTDYFKNLEENKKYTLKELGLEVN